jgi:hypothetical protein
MGRRRGLSGKHRKVLEAVFAEPAPASIAWADIEALFRALGAMVTEGRGSRVRVELSDVRSVFHRPHPGKQASRGTVRAVRDFLMNAGVRP